MFDFDYFEKAQAKREKKERIPESSENLVHHLPKFYFIKVEYLKRTPLQSEIRRSHLTNAAYAYRKNIRYRFEFTTNRRILDRKFIAFF